MFTVLKVWCLPHLSSKAINAVQILHGLHQAVCHGFFTSTESHAWVVVLLVGLLSTLWVANLGLEVVHVLLLVLVHAIPEGPLGVSVNVHLDHTCLDGILDVFSGGTRSTVEDEGHWLVALTAQLLLDVLLGVVKDHWLQGHVSRSVDTVHVAEGCSHSEVAVWHRGESLVDLPNFFRLCVEARRIHIRVIHAILITTSDAQLHLQKEVHFGHALPC